GVGTSGVVAGVGGSRIGASDGPTFITASAGSSAVFALTLEAGGEISGGFTGPITIATDSIDIQGGTINSSSGLTTITTRTAGTVIDLGGADRLSGSSLRLGLTSAELAQISASSLQIGDGSGGPIVFSGAVTSPNPLVLVTSATVSGAGALTMLAGRDLRITAGGGIDLSGPLTVPATLILNVGAADIALTNAGNDFNTVAIPNAAFVTLQENSGFVLGESTITGVLSIQTDSAVSQSGPLGGTGGLTLRGTGGLTLSFANTYSGTTTVSGGTLQFDGFSPALNGQFGLNGGTLAYNLGVPSTVLTPTIAITAASTIDVAGGTTITLSDVISGAGGLTKTGAGTLVLGNEFNSFGPAPLNIADGTLQVATDGALGDAGNPVVFQTATLQTTAAFMSGRHVTLQSGVATFQIDGPSLTLLGVIDGTGTRVVTGPGLLQTTRVFTGGDVTESGGAPSVIGNTSVSVGKGTAIIHLVDGDPTKIDTIELMNTTSRTKLVIKSTNGLPTTIQHIIISDPTQPLGSIVLGPGVSLGDGLHDSVPELDIKGKVGKLQFDAINSYALLSIGQGLPYDAAGNKTPDTYNNNPSLKVRAVSGPGVIFDVTGGVFTPGTTGSPGGGGLGKVLVEEWNFPGAIRTTQSIKSFTLKTGDCEVVFSVDKFGVGVLTTAGIGSMSVPPGAWASTGSVVEGGITRMTTGDFLAGADITAGAITTFTVNGDFEGTVSSAGAMRNITVKGKFAGSLQAASVGKITADLFDGTDLTNSDPYGDSSRRNINITTGGMGMVIAKPHDLDTFGIKNYEISVATSFAGFSVTDKTAPGSFVGIDRVTVQAGSIGNTTVKVTAAASAKAIQNSVFESNGAMGTLNTSHSIANSIFAAATNIAQVTVKGNFTGSKLLAGTFLGSDAKLGGINDAADVFDRSGRIAGVTVLGAFSASTIAAGIDSVDGIYGNSDDVLATTGTALTGKATAIGSLKFGAGSGTIGSSPTNTHLHAIEAASIKSLSVDRVAVKPLPAALPKYLDLGAAGEGAADVLVRILS
ncbi:MAG: autotransporter-associated beta strand repeat-containing protein, partial [Chthoniobacteraceae bacterium]